MNDSFLGDWVYKDETYSVERQVQLKNPVTCEWVRAVMYRKWKFNELEFYVRELGDFLSKFKRVEDEDD